VLAATLTAPRPFALAQVGGAGASDADQRAHAKQRFEQGIADYDAARYEQALANFQEALRVRPHPLVHVNVANCYDKLRKPLQALFHFQRFLESDTGTPEQRSEVSAAVERLRKQVGQLLLRITPDGATVIIDQGEQRRAPLLDAVQLEAGDHTLEVLLEGYKPLRRNVTVRGGATFELNLALERASAEDDEDAHVLNVVPVPEPGAESPPAETNPTAAPAGNPQRTPDAEFDLAREGPESGSGVPATVWVTGALTAGLGIAALVTGVLALSAEADFDTDRDRLVLATTPNERVALHASARDHADRAHALALATDILLVATGVGAALTAYFALSAQSSERAGVKVTPAVARGGGGMLLSSRF
jgi:hypothetical protein